MHGDLEFVVTIDDFNDVVLLLKSVVDPLLELVRFVGECVVSVIVTVDVLATLETLHDGLVEGINSEVGVKTSLEWNLGAIVGGAEFVIKLVLGGSDLLSQDEVLMAEGHLDIQLLGSLLRLHELKLVLAGDGVQGLRFRTEPRPANGHTGVGVVLGTNLGIRALVKVLTSLCLVGNQQTTKGCVCDLESVTFQSRQLSAHVGVDGYFSEIKTSILYDI